MRAFWTLLLTVVGMAACVEYDPPPMPELLQTNTGAWGPEDALTIQMSESIDKATFSFSIWPQDLDVEGNILEGTKPIVDRCTLSNDRCGELGIALNEDATQITVEQNGMFEEYLGKPLILEVHEGLKDLKGRERKVPTWFDFQVSLGCSYEPIELELDSDVFTLAADLQVLPVWLHMYLNLAVSPETGEMMTIATFARIDNTIDPKPPSNSYDPLEHVAALDKTGWAVPFRACMDRRGENEYFFESEPFDISITLLELIPVTLDRFTVRGTIILGGGPDGRDQVSGTLTTSGGAFGAGDSRSEVDGITTAWKGLSVRSGEVAEGLPMVCKEDPCGTLASAGGDCQVPKPWDVSDYCEEAE